MAPRKSNREHTVISTAASKSYSSKASSSKVSPKASPVSDQHLTLQQIVLGVWDNYQEVTPQRIRLVDVFLTFLVIVGVLQFIYCLIAGNYPFNAFLSGFSATVGQFVLTTILRIQTNDKNNTEFKNISPERAFADYVFGSLILHFFCVNFIN